MTPEDIEKEVIELVKEWDYDVEVNEYDGFRARDCLREKINDLINDVLNEERTARQEERKQASEAIEKLVGSINKILMEVMT